MVLNVEKLSTVLHGLAKNSNIIFYVEEEAIEGIKKVAVFLRERAGTDSNVTRRSGATSTSVSLTLKCPFSVIQGMMRTSVQWARFPEPSANEIELSHGVWA